MSSPTPPTDLFAAAERVMREHGFAVDTPPGVTHQLAGIESQAHQQPSANVRDLRRLLWSSIDNDTSRDLDQLEVAEAGINGDVKVLVAIADVDAFVSQDSPIDHFAAEQTTTVYTGVRNFTMLPQQLSTGVTSLLESDDKLAVVVEFTVEASGQLTKTDVYRAVVRNQAQLTYDTVGPWLDGRGVAPPHVSASVELQAQLKLQNVAATTLRNERHRHGALNIDTLETRPVMRNDEIVDLEAREKNSATGLIEDFMIAANEVVARLLEDHRCSFIERIVKTPARWDRIVALAAERGTDLPDTPNSRALNDFLMAQSARDPDHFPDLSLAVVKLMGPGEYVVTEPGQDRGGHFGLAVDDYTHSTAPNRRFADLVTQRLIKSVLAGTSSPYSNDRLNTIATNCTAKANEARKVEREMSKRIAAVALEHRIGEQFDAIVTGVTPHGTFVRIVKPHVEGLLENAQGLDVGDKLRVTLVRTDAERGYLDFARR